MPCKTSRILTSWTLRKLCILVILQFRSVKHQDVCLIIINASHANYKLALIFPTLEMIIISQWPLISNIWPPSSGLSCKSHLCFPATFTDASTVEGQIIMPKNANYHLSLKSAIFAKASPTWWPTVQSKHNSCHQDLRGNQQPQQEKMMTWATPPYLPRALISWGKVVRETQAPIKKCQAAFGTNSGFSFSNRRNECPLLLLYFSQEIKNQIKLI